MSEKQKRSSLIIISINDLPDKNEIARKRFAGLIEALKIGLPILIIVVIYKKNVEKLSSICQLLKKVSAKYGNSNTFNIEFRLMFIKDTPSIVLKKSVPGNFLQVKQEIKKSLDILKNSNIKVTLLNFPLCYIDKLDKANRKSLVTKQLINLIEVYKVIQKIKFETMDWTKYLKKHKECEKCSVNSFCSGIDISYINKYGYRKLKAI